MTDERASATTTINAPAETVFWVLADPATHAAIDGTGWVCESLDGEHLTGAGQLFRMAMYRDNHPDGHYEMANGSRHSTRRTPSRGSRARTRPVTATSSSVAGSGATT